MYSDSARAEKGGNSPPYIIGGDILDIILYNTNSPKNKINKSLSNELTITGTMRNNTSILTPTILIQYNPVNYNYAYIPQFNRYYYIADIIFMTNSMVELYLKVDVLMSHRIAILNSDVIIDKTTDNPDLNRYVYSDGFSTLCKDKTDIIQFPNGFNDNGEYILITAGG